MGVGLVLQNPIIAASFLRRVSLLEPGPNRKALSRQVQADCHDEDQIPQKTALVISSEAIVRREPQKLTRRLDRDRSPSHSLVSRRLLPMYPTDPQETDFSQ